MTGQHTVTHCHCGLARGNSDHCAACGCEEFERVCSYVYENATPSNSLLRRVVCAIKDHDPNKVTWVIADDMEPSPLRMILRRCNRCGVYVESTPLPWMRKDST